MQAPLPLLSPARSAVAQVLSELLPGVDTTVVDGGRWDTDGTRATADAASHSLVASSSPRVV